MRRWTKRILIVLAVSVLPSVAAALIVLALFSLPTAVVGLAVAAIIVLLLAQFYSFSYYACRQSERGERELSSLIAELDALGKPWRWHELVAAQPASPDSDKARALILDRKSTRLNSSHIQKSRMPSSA